MWWLVNSRLSLMISKKGFTATKLKNYCKFQINFTEVLHQFMKVLKQIGKVFFSKFGYLRFECVPDDTWLFKCICFIWLADSNRHWISGSETIELVCSFWFPSDSSRIIKKAKLYQIRNFRVVRHLIFQIVEVSSLRPNPVLQERCFIHLGSYSNHFKKIILF